MALTELTQNLNVHQSLPDKPTLPAEELKSEFDKPANIIKEYLNGTLKPELDAIITNLQNKDITLQTALTSVQTVVNEATTNITKINDSLKSGATTKITIGTEVPETLEEGEVYLQCFE